MIEIVFPNGNENEFIKIAELLGIKELIFVYDFEKKFFTSANSKIKIYNAVSTIQNNKNKKTQLVIYKAQENVREVIERSNADIIFALEEIQKKDALHHRISGINQVLCKLAVKNNVLLGFSYASLLNKNHFIKSQIMGRMMQNILLFRKFKNNFCISSFSKSPFHMRSPNDVASLFKCLGMHPQEVKCAFSSILEKIN